MRMEAQHDGQNSLRSHLSRCVQAYGTQPTRTHTTLTIENRNNKQKQAGQVLEWKNMIQSSTPKTIHGEAFDKVCKVLNRVHHMKCTDWNLHVPAVAWAYRTMCKTLTMQALPKLKYETRVEIPTEQAKPSPHVTAPVDTMICIDRNKEITQLRETEHIRLQEETRQGNFRLRELEKDQVWLREKSALMDAEVKKFENKIKEAILIKKLRMVRQCVYNHTDKLEDDRHELVSLRPWLGSHITKRNDQGRTLQIV